MLVEVDPDYQPLPHVVRAHKNSECRTPIILVREDGDPFQSVVTIAKAFGSSVWNIEMGNPKNEQNAIDYVDVGVQNGDWVYLTNVEEATPEVLRSIATTLVTLKPDPKRFPRREHFRVFFTVQKPIDMNDNISSPFPRLMLQNAILARRLTTAEGGSPTKWLKHLPEEENLRTVEIMKHVKRRDAGRDSDSESDADEPENKITGMWFHRAVDFYSKEEGASLRKPSDELFEAVEECNVERIRELCQSGKVDIARVKRDGMTPLQYAVSRERIPSCRALLEAGADPNVPRESDGCPPLFMCIESDELLLLLVEFGVDIHAKFENERVENHFATPPHIAALVKKIRSGELAVEQTEKH